MIRGHCNLTVLSPGENTHLFLRVAVCSGSFYITMRRLLTAVFLIPIIVLGQDPGSMTALAAVGANAGPDQKAKLRDLVVLNGSASVNPSGVGTLSYSWKFSSKPAGSSATLLYES